MLQKMRTGHIVPRLADLSALFCHSLIHDWKSLPICWASPLSALLQYSSEWTCNTKASFLHSTVYEFTA